MQRRTLLAFVPLAAAAPWAPAHHGWSGFDQNRPIYLEGKARDVAWRNPHAEVKLELSAALAVPADLAARRMPAQTTTVDASRILAAATLPTRKDKVWEVELGPLTRMDAWKVPEIKTGDSVAVIGYAALGEQGAAVLRAEYLFVGGKIYGLRSSPA